MQAIDLVLHSTDARLDVGIRGSYLLAVYREICHAQSLEPIPNGFVDGRFTSNNLASPGAVQNQGVEREAECVRKPEGLFGDQAAAELVLRQPNPEGRSAARGFGSHDLPAVAIDNRANDR